ncbi:MAG TPA: UPF0280 family protein [Xanthobacteraceae bacterium]|nr:UPF0280 family protein [Xanthobacteraceae bacterium]
MRIPPQRSLFADGRLHLHDGPIDLIIEAFGEPLAVERAYDAAWRRFATILDELCTELPLLRSQAKPTSARPCGVVAGRMADAVAPLCISRFITPMAAVAGAVADEILLAMTKAAPLQRAYVNNGGDIALHLVPGESFSIGMIDRPDRPSLIGSATILGGDAIRGVATSGWRGRSFSLGIADAVTILARSAAQADAAATLVANAVDLPGHPAVRRMPAHLRDPQSDLGERLVTVDVGPLTQDEIEEALAAGRDEAERLRRAAVIEAAALQLCGQTVVCGGALDTLPAPSRATVRRLRIRRAGTRRPRAAEHPGARANGVGGFR